MSFLYFCGCYNKERDGPPEILIKKRKAMEKDSPLKQVLTIDEAAEYMGLKKSYLYKLTSERRIPHFKPNGKKIYFEREALTSWMMSNPVLTQDELNSRAQAYCMGGRGKRRSA